MPPRKPSPVGAHVPVSGGLAKGLAYAAEVRAPAVQQFVPNPRGRPPRAGAHKQDEQSRGPAPDAGAPLDGRGGNEAVNDPSLVRRKRFEVTVSSDGGVQAHEFDTL